MKLVRLDGIFETYYGVNLELSNICQTPDGIPFVGRAEKNNGVTARVEVIEGIEPNPANTISVAGGGSVMSSFLQKSPYYSGRDLYYLKPQVNLTDKEMLYYCMCLKANKYRFSYGRQANKTLDSLMVPSVASIPDWVNTIKIPTVNKQPIVIKHYDLNISKWKYFDLIELFGIQGTQSFTKQQIQQYGIGRCPYVVTSSENNGVQGFYNHFTEEGNVITIDSATIGSSFYQVDNFSASDHVEKLIPKFSMNKYHALFITTVLNLEKIRYGYGRKFAQMRIKRTKIKLPKTLEGGPDWEFMENYIKSLSYSSAL